MGLSISSSSSSRLPLTSPFSSSSSPSKFKFSLSILNSSSFSSLPTQSKSNSNSAPCCSLASNTNVPKPSNAIDRVVLRLRNLGLASLDDEPPPTSTADRFLHREWVRPDATLPVALPWDKEEQQEKEDKWLRKKMNKKGKEAPTMAGLTLGEEEMKRLRTLGMQHVKKERVSVPKAGLTRAVLDQIHRHWNNNELVKLKFHEHLAHNMNLAHRIVEHRTGGLVIWRSGSVMFVYRGKNYQGPTTGSNQHNVEGGEGDDYLVPRISPESNATSSLALEKSEPVGWWNQQQLTAEEAEFDRMLDCFGPRFVDWWGTGILPVDADLLPPTVPGYRTPLRLLPAGMRRRLTNDEVTNMRKLAKVLPCHFALGRNRNLQGLACAILKLWEKSLVAKIAIKRGVQNTNNELMAQELKNLTGGTLLLRNKYYIVIYRGKDFIPTSVAAVVAERQELTKQVQDVEVKVQRRAVDITTLGGDETTSQAGSLAEFYEAQSHWGRDISTEEHEKMMKEAAKAKNVRLVKKIEHKLAVAQAKRLRAEKQLAKIEVSMAPSGPCNNRETITDEERVMLRAVGLRMKAYLQLGTRGVFDGVIENMHLHWKHRELVKLITKQKILAFVEDTARLLEYESGGILVAIDRLPKGFSLIYYRGKNYRRPITLRPRNLSTKAKALQHSIAMQRHEALSQHITELGEKIEEMKKELNEDEGSDDDDNDGDFGDTEDTDWDDDDSELLNMENDGFPMKAG